MATVKKCLECGNTARERNMSLTDAVQQKQTELFTVKEKVEFLTAKNLSVKHNIQYLTEEMSRLRKAIEIEDQKLQKIVLKSSELKLKRINADITLAADYKNTDPYIKLINDKIKL